MCSSDSIGLILQILLYRAGLDHWDSRDTAIRMAKEIRGRAHGRTPTAGREPSGIESLTRLGAWESRTTELFGLADRTGGRGRLVPGRVIDSRSRERGGATTLTAWDSERSLRLLDERGGSVLPSPGDVHGARRQPNCDDTRPSVPLMPIKLRRSALYERLDTLLVVAADLGFLGEFLRPLVLGVGERSLIYQRIRSPSSR